ncbi:MAG: transcription elongation factor GreA [Solirubrobacteraceae bacterium]|nr:transcription elongation factor GreA [Solirubrobacteraceae bacterium]
MSDSVVMTAEDFAALSAEIERLEGEGRRDIAARIKTAREWGDLKENAEYHDAKNAQAHLETKILVLREKQRNAEIREVQAGGDSVGFGSTVTVLDEQSGREMTYTLVSPTEAKPAEGKLAFDSPVGEALQGAKVGQSVAVSTPKGDRPLKILTIA